ncbi:MAG: hypothetical protein V3W44_00775, partial [Dehalococcoidales bacterium]
MIDFHRKRHKLPPDAPLQANIGIDGIQEAAANKVSLNVFALQFYGCRNVYPLLVQRPTMASKITYNKEQAELALA